MIKKVVKWFTITTFIVIVVTDIIFEILGYTISEYYTDLVWIDELWILPFYTAIILGHCGINLFKKITFSWWRYIVLGSLVVLTLILDLTISIHIPWYITIPGGLTVGALLWPQKRKKKHPSTLS